MVSFATLFGQRHLSLITHNTCTGSLLDTNIPGFSQLLLPFPSCLGFQLGMCWEMSSKEAFAVSSGSPHGFRTLSQLPREAEPAPREPREFPSVSMAHTAMLWNSRFQQGKDAPALKNKALKGLKHKWSKILQCHCMISFRTSIKGCFSLWIGEKNQARVFG